jgi:hypothetical protein
MRGAVASGELEIGFRPPFALGRFVLNLDA